MLICDVVPTAGGLGLTDPRILAPGAADRSVVLERMRLRDVNAMPPLGSNLVDIAGSALVEHWIRRLGVPRLS